MQLVSSVARFFWPERPRFGNTLDGMHMRVELPVDRRGLYRDAVTSFDTDMNKVRRFTLTSQQRQMGSFITAFAGFPIIVCTNLAAGHPALQLAMQVVGGALFIGGFGSAVAANMRRAKSVSDLGLAPFFRQQLINGRQNCQFDGPTPFTDVDWERVRSLSHLSLPNPAH